MKIIYVDRTRTSKPYTKKTLNSMNIGYHLTDYDKAIYELSKRKNQNCDTFDTRTPW